MQTAAPPHRVELINPPLNRAIVLKNLSCPYCAKEITRKTSTREHVVGSKFVPEDSFDASWNLILRACTECNGTKSDLEDDISAITMLPQLTGGWAKDGPDISANVHRKIKAISRQTRKPVSQSKENFVIAGQLMPGVNVKFTMSSDPLIDETRVHHLAWFHVTGFFYWITFRPDVGKGSAWPGDFMPVVTVKRDDWGNPIADAFAKAVFDWEPRAMATTKDGFFKIAIRRHLTSDTWSFALEWNHSYRVMGFIGDRKVAQALRNTFPELQWDELPPEDRTLRRARTEVPMEGEDLLFAYDDGRDVDCEAEANTIHSAS